MLPDDLAGRHHPVRPRPSVPSLDCQQPRILSAEERLLLFTYCRDHPVGKCIACAADFNLSDLALDVLGFRRYLPGR